MNPKLDTMPTLAPGPDVALHSLPTDANVRMALERLNQLPQSLTLFVQDADGKLMGTITDGDIRRGLLAGHTLEDSVSQLMNRKFRSLQQGVESVRLYHELREANLKIVPVLDAEGRLLRLVNTHQTRSVLPLDAIIMAGGEGRRLRPLTEHTPKPLLHVGNMPIIERNVERLRLYGVNCLWITLNYLGQQLRDYFGDGSSRGMDIHYVDEAGRPLGTFGSVALVRDTPPGLDHNHVLVMNSDLLTNIDYEDFFLDFLNQGADMAVASIPYEVRIPYAVLERQDRAITSFREKPTYTYYSNAGIYLIRRELLEIVPTDKPYNATDFMEYLIAAGHRVIHYPILGYWLDIGKPEDYEKAQRDVEHIQF